MKYCVAHIKFPQTEIVVPVQCELVNESQILPDSLMLQSVKYLTDSTYTDIYIESLIVRKEHIVYLSYGEKRSSEEEIEVIEEQEDEVSTLFSETDKKSESKKTL